MEKYGVDVETEEAKIASEKAKPACPSCGHALAPSAASNVPICPRCGTEPFEPREGGA